ncbi:MAG: hypothetical protein RSC76_02890 [Oscillospiraceae bacterium]
MMEKSKNRRFRQAVKMEVREHKSSFVVFCVLNIFVITTLVRQIFMRNYESVFLSALTLLLLVIPSVVQVSFKIELPTTLEIIVLLFIFAAEILGEINSFYILIPFWDTILHTLNGFLAAAIGCSLIVILNGNDKLTFTLSPLFVAIVAFCFSMTIGVIWEFFEFGMDAFFHLDMQKDTVIHALHSMMLDPTNSNHLTTVNGIQEVIINGNPLGVGGYLDIGLLDTMEDLFVNFIGAFVFSVFGYFYAKSKGKGKVAKRFIPSIKTPDHDYFDGPNKQ